MKVKTINAIGTYNVLKQVNKYNNEKINVARNP